MTVQYTIASNHQTGLASAFLVYSDGTTTTVPSTHPSWDSITTALLAQSDEEEIKQLIDARIKVKAFTALSDRVSWRKNKLYFDGDRVRGPIVKHILRMVREEDPQAGSLVQFMENLATNPDEESREALYTWLTDRDFTITPDGHFIAYKGVKRGTHFPSFTGTAWVNGVELVNDYIPNHPGTLVTMPRATVDDDRTIGCSTGLHTGTFRFAKSFSEVVMAVKVNPRDVVSVPHGDSSNWEKLRVCRYYVLAEVTEPYQLPVHEPQVAAYAGPDLGGTQDPWNEA